ncbi:carbonic anhydrase [Peniophora sp. CONT]|nr:carbonic anhydrase [Peniophora sp. CONT]
MPWRIFGGCRSAHLREAASRPSSPTSPIGYRRQFVRVHSRTDPAIAKLLNSNSDWARAVEASEPRLFREMAKGQTPKILWIGCSDSRVPESIITAAKPGDIFVHRNIANQFRLDDDSALSVLTYAIDQLGVEHVVVVGHTQCGGATACYEAAKHAHPAAPLHSPLGRWLSPLTDMATKLNLGHTEPDHAVTALVEANVRKQVENLCEAEPLRKVWDAEGARRVWVHGLLFEVESGTLKDLGVTYGPPRDGHGPPKEEEHEMLFSK